MIPDGVIAPINDFSKKVSKDLKPRLVYAKNVIEALHGSVHDTLIKNLVPKINDMFLQREGADSFEQEFDENTTSKFISQSKGKELPLPTRQKMEDELEHDFDDVRIHDDEAANEASQSVNANAFTTGKNVYFDKGKYNPDSKDGQKLIAHELTHVVQQQNGGNNNLVQRDYKTDIWKIIIKKIKLSVAQKIKFKRALNKELKKK